MSGYEIKIYMDELIQARIGEKWSIEDQDRYPNRTRTFDVSVTKIYEDDDGVLIKEYYGDDDVNPVTLIWIEKRK